jgi:hypothetical protein
MLDRRKAMIGWLVYTGAKPFLKQALKARAKGAKDAVPGASTKGRGARRFAAMLGAAGAALGGVLVWRRLRSDDDAEATKAAAGNGGATSSATASAGSEGAGGDGSEPSPS